MAWSTPRDWTNGEIVTQTMLNTDLRDNMRELWHEVAYVEYTAAVTCTGAEATPTTVVASGAVTYGGFPVIVEFFTPEVGGAGTATGGFNLWEGTSTDLGRMYRTVGLAAGATNGGAVVARRLTPSAGAHTYTIRGWISAGTNIVANAGAGGAGTYNPGYIRILEKGGA